MMFVKEISTARMCLQSYNIFGRLSIVLPNFFQKNARAPSGSTFFPHQAFILLPEGQTFNPRGTAGGPAC